jgi:branched-chain amino acid transport system substrate-binding protein
MVADPQIVAVLGTTCSASAVTAIEVLSQAGLVMISGSNSAPSLTSVAGKPGEHWRPGFFRTIHNSADMGRAAAIFAFQELGIRQAAAIHDGDPYTQGSANAFQQAFTELGGELVLATSINKEDIDLCPVLRQISHSQAELAFLALFPQAGERLVQQVREVPGLKDMVWLASGSLSVASFVETARHDAQGMYCLNVELIQNTAIEAFVAKYITRYGEKLQHNTYAYAYDAANLLFQAIEAVAVQEEDGRLHIGRQALRDALYATSDFPGIIGKLSCDRFGDCGATRLNVTRFDDPAGGFEGLLSNVVYTYTK